LGIGIFGFLLLFFFLKKKTWALKVCRLVNSANCEKKNILNLFLEICEFFVLISMHHPDFDPCALRDLRSRYRDYFGRGDKGLADLFVDLYQAFVKVTDIKGNGYKWDDERKLWDRMTAPELELFMSDALEMEINSAMSNSLKDHEEDLNRLLHGKILNQRSFGGVFQVAKLNLFAAQKTIGFEQKINAADPEVVPIKGGKLISLRTGAVRDRQESDLFSFELDVAFLGMDHRCARGERFFREICAGREDLKRYFLQAFGYCLTGETKEKVFFILQGGGHNGKTTMMKIMEAILGPYYSPCSKHVFLKNSKRYQDAGSATPELLTFKGKRLVSCSETSESEMLNEAQVKELTGGGTIRARGLYEMPQNFPNQAKVMMESNEVPSFNATDGALQFRMKLLPFLSYFLRDGREAPRDQEAIYKEDPDFIDDLIKNGGGLDEIFTILVRDGTMAWYAEGCALKEPEICKALLHKLVDERDFLQDFLDDCCVRDENCRIKTSEFNTQFAVWCKMQGFPKVDARVVKKRMDSKTDKPRKIQGLYYYVGLKFRNHKG
jgi:putative DNA primase/helicase